MKRVIFQTLREHKWLSLGIVCTVCGAVLAALLPPLILANIIDTLTQGKTVSFLFILLYFGMLALTGLLESAREGLLTVLGQKITHALRSGLMAKFVRLTANELNRQEPGTLVSRFVGDVDTVENLFSSGIISMFADACKIISLLVVIRFQNRGLMLVLLVLLPFLFWFTRHVQKNMLAAQLQNRIAVSRASGHVPETLHNIRTIHCLGKEKYMETRYDKYIGESYRAMEKTNFYDAVYSPVILILNAVVVAVVMLLSASGNPTVLTLFGMSAGTAVAVMNYISQIFSPVESLGMEIQTIQSAVAGIKRINEFLALPELERKQKATAAELERKQETTAAELEKKQETSAAELEREQETTAAELERKQETSASEKKRKQRATASEKKWKQRATASESERKQKATAAELERKQETTVPEQEKKLKATVSEVGNVRNSAHIPCVEFQNVTFGYDEHVVLNNLSFAVQTGEQVTLSGRTGAGKSTILKLLLGLYEPQSGKVLIQGIPAEDIPKEERRRLFGYVEQSFHMVQGTVKDQITLFDKSISTEQVRAAAALTGMEETIENLERGYDTICTPELFSQGQWQLLSIARAVVAEPRLLLLDEITANLDAETEKTVLQALKRVSADRTVISISHRVTAETGRVIGIASNGGEC